MCDVTVFPGEEVPPARARGQGEEEGTRRGGEEQRVCPQGGGEEHRPHPEVGGEVPGVHWQLPADVRAGRSSGENVMLCVCFDDAAKKKKGQQEKFCNGSQLLEMKKVFFFWEGEGRHNVALLHSNKSSHRWAHPSMPRLASDMAANQAERVHKIQKNLQC